MKAFADEKVNFNNKIKLILGKGRKHCRKSSKCWLLTFSPFSTMFSKAFWGSFKVETALAKGYIS